MNYHPRSHPDYFATGTPAVEQHYHFHRQLFVGCDALLRFWRHPGRVVAFLRRQDVGLVSNQQIVNSA